MISGTQIQIPGMLNLISTLLQSQNFAEQLKNGLEYNTMWLKSLQQDRAGNVYFQ